MPWLVIGLDENIFWKQTPKTIKIYFEANKIREQKKVQEMWLSGLYFKQALSSTILVAGLADKNTSQRMPKYPQCPYNEVKEVQLTEEQKQYERMRLVQYLNSFSKR